jgi:hypothetical protein
MNTLVATGKSIRRDVARSLLNSVKQRDKESVVDGHPVGRSA